MSHETHIVGLIIHVLSEHWDEVLKKTNQLPKAESHRNKKEHKFVLVFEAESETALASHVDKINEWQGVLSVRLCYHHCEADESLDEEIQYATYTS